ncbi:hemoglobin subunit alpha-like [Mobula birostris]|uniref:hemoglobin subunit alpha-like n=1 Tax=Mobula birostris TaxID=1983395 RepID=UPI003B27D838
MVLSDSMRRVIEELGSHIRTNAEAWGADALARLFQLCPQTKMYFKKFDGFKASDSCVKMHGYVVMTAVADATRNLDNLSNHLKPLAKEHGEVIHVEPPNFFVFSKCITVTLAIHLPAFTPATHNALDKFLELLSYELSSMYR